MKFTKEDYMKLDKERLVEMLLEVQEREDVKDTQVDYPYNPYRVTPYYVGTPCWAENGECSNPYHDCINCPKKSCGVYTTNTIGKKWADKDMAFESIKSNTGDKFYKADWLNEK